MYHDKIQKEREYSPHARGLLSLLGYCYFHTRSFVRAGEVYDQLVQMYPDVEEYAVSLIHSLINAGAIRDADLIVSKWNADTLSQKMLDASIQVKLERDDLDACRSLLNDTVCGDPSTLVAEALVCHKEGQIELALQKFLDVFEMIEFEPCLAYNIALCYYMLKDFALALDFVDRILSKGWEKYPELASPRNPTKYLHIENHVALQESHLIEAYNLKAAIEYSSNNFDDCKETLASMPPREEKSLDPVTLHNDALFYLEKETQSSFEKFRFLLANPPFPPVTFQNLLLLYCKHGYTDMAADFLADNPQLTLNLVDQDLVQYTRSLSISDHEEALKQLESISDEFTKTINSLNRELNKYIDTGNEDMIAMISEKTDHKISILISIIMARAQIYWKQKDYLGAEQVLLNAPDVCTDSYPWKLNMAHVLFVQQRPKIKECIPYYQSLVDDEIGESILRVPPVILANLCVALILSNENEKAEAIIKEIEIAEMKSATSDLGLVETLNNHRCIVNLVIGTLYCEKANFEFGLERIQISLDPYTTKLNLNTWYYVKRCLLALADKVTKHMVVPSESLKGMVIAFLNDVLSSISDAEMSDNDTVSIASIVTEAKKLRSVFLLLNKEF
jgi:tetratricopeptide repeat protein 30